MAQNDGLSQDGMTCTAIPTLLRALPCCCTIVAHGCAAALTWNTHEQAACVSFYMRPPGHVTSGLASDLFISLLVDRSCASLRS